MNRSFHSRRDPAAAPWVRAATALGVGLGIIAVLAMLGPGPMYRFGWLGLGSAFGLMRYAVWLGIAAAVIALLGLALALFARIHRWRLRAVLGIVLGLIALSPPLMFMHDARSVPPIHDISTDTVNPPQFHALLAQRANTPNPPGYGGAAVATEQHAAYPDIEPLDFKAAPAVAFDAALKTARAMGWAIAAEAPAEGRIEATATTRWFGFKDDVVIRVQAQGGGSRLDIRSQSRVGRSDVGANAARIRAFRQRLETRLGDSSR